MSDPDVQFCVYMINKYSDNYVVSFCNNSYQSELQNPFKAIYQTERHIALSVADLLIDTTVYVAKQFIFTGGFSPLLSARQHLSYGDCLEVKREYYQNCCVLDYVTQCSQSAAHLSEQFLQVKQIGFVTLGPLCCA